MTGNCKTNDKKKPNINMVLKVINLFLRVGRYTGEQF